MITPPKGPIKRTFGPAPHEKPFVEVGAEVTCPNRYCRKSIARFVKQLNAGEMITSAHLLGPTITRGAEMKCHACGIPWFLVETAQIHLSTGWAPKYE